MDSGTALMWVGCQDDVLKRSSGMSTLKGEHFLRTEGSLLVEIVQHIVLNKVVAVLVFGLESGKGNTLDTEEPLGYL